MIAMVSHPQSIFDQIGNALSGPQLCPISMSHRSLAHEMNKLFFLFQGQTGRSSGCRLGFQCFAPTGLQGIAPTHNATRMATYTAGDLIKGKLLVQEPNHTASTLFQEFWRPLRSHRSTPTWDVSIILHYLWATWQWLPAERECAKHISPPE